MYSATINQSNKSLNKSFTNYKYNLAQVKLQYQTGPQGDVKDH